MFYILKLFIPGSQIWVAQLNPSDPVYSYDTLEEAEKALPGVQALYPNNECKVSSTI